MQAHNQEPGTGLSGTLQQCSPDHFAVSTGTTQAVIIEQLQAVQSHLLHHQRENQQLLNNLSQLKQQHNLLELSYAICQQVVKAQTSQLTEKDSIIQRLESQLAEILGYCQPVLGSAELPGSHGQLQGQQLQRLVVAGFSRPLQQQQQLEQAVPAVHAEAASAGAVLQPRVPMVGRKRARWCSATGSAGDAAVAAPLGLAASGRSSSSWQQWPGDDEDVNEIEPLRRRSFRGSHSPTVSEPLQSAAGVEQALTAAPDQLDAVDEEEKSHEELEAAECLQALATSALEVDGPVEDGMFYSASNLMTYQGLSSMVVAAPSYTRSAEQNQQTQQQQHAVTVGGRRKNSLPQGDADKGDAGAANTTASKRAQKKSSFGNEVKKVTPPEQQACVEHWAAKQCVKVVCNGLEGTYQCVKSDSETGRHVVKLDDGRFLAVGSFEKEANRLKSRNWQQSVYVVEYAITGALGRKPMKMGIFLRIVGVKPLHPT